MENKDNTLKKQFEELMKWSCEDEGGRGFFFIAFNRDGAQTCGADGDDDALAAAFFRAYKADPEVRKTLRPIFMSLLIGEMAQIKKKADEQALEMLLCANSGTDS